MTSDSAFTAELSGLAASSRLHAHACTRTGLMVALCPGDRDLKFGT